LHILLLAEGNGGRKDLKTIGTTMKKYTSAADQKVGLTEIHKKKKKKIEKKATIPVKL